MGVRSLTRSPGTVCLRAGSCTTVVRFLHAFSRPRVETRLLRFAVTSPPLGCKGEQNAQAATTIHGTLKRGPALAEPRLDRNKSYRYQQSDTAPRDCCVDLGWRSYVLKSMSAHAVKKALHGVVDVSTVKHIGFTSFQGASMCPRSPWQIGGYVASSIMLWLTSSN